MAATMIMVIKTTRETTMETTIKATMTILETAMTISNGGNNQQPQSMA